MPLEVIDLCHSYKEGTPFVHEALQGINLYIDDGEFVGIIGPTRSGKSTLAQHFNALYIPRRGKVLIDGNDTKDKNTDLVRLRHRVGYVFQNPDYQLFASTVGEDVSFGPRRQNLPPEEIKARVRESLELVGLDYEAFFKRDIYALSGGQKRRAAIAGVLACKPRILVLDDITAGLDPAGREEILAVIARLHSENQITTIFVSSSMDDVSVLAERIIVMHEGRIIIDDTTRAVFSRADELEEIGLELPEVTVLVEKLRKLGYKLPPGLFNIEEAQAAIAMALDQGRAEQ